MIENVIGTHALPLGVAINFLVNGRDVLVPMAIEEPSVVAGARSWPSSRAPAAASRRETSDAGDDRTDADARRRRIPPPRGGAARAQGARSWSWPNQIDPVLIRLGGGARDLEVRRHRGLADRRVAGRAPDLRHARRDGRQRGQHGLRDARPDRRADHRRACASAHPVEPGRPALARARCAIPVQELAFGGVLGRATCATASSRPAPSPRPIPTARRPTTRAS